jgi:hypothetical protein
MVDPPLKNWIFSKPDVVTIEYHTSFPYAGDPFYLANIPEQQNRVFYYLVPSVPAVRIDGPHPPAGLNPTAYENLYQQRKAIPARARLELEGEYDLVSRTGTLTVRAIADESMPGDWRLRVAITESDIHYQAPNGINVHHHVFRRFAPDTTGTLLSFPGPFPDTETAVLPFAIDPGWAHENVDLVVMLQEQGSREIEQGGAIGVLDLVVAVDDNPAPAAPAGDRIIAVVPNPFNPRTRVPFELERAGRTVLTVHDPAGRLVRVLVDDALSAGGHAAEWDGRDAAGREVGAGIYLLRLEGPTAAASRKAVLLR